MRTPSNVSSADSTISIDPTQSDAITIQTPMPAPVVEELPGPVASAIDSVIPDTGNRAIDSSLDTFSSSIGGLLDSLVAHLPQLIIAIVLVVVTAIAAGIASKWGTRFARRVRMKPNLQDLFGKLVFTSVWFFGLIAAAGVVFPGLGMGELVASAGLASIAIGFAFQDIFENFLAGILIIWRFPFEDGDFISLPSEGVEGKVEEVRIRMTLIRAVEGELILVPNATIYKNVVHVLTNRPARRMKVMCGVAYGEDVGESRRVIAEAVTSCPSVMTGRPIDIFAEGFGASSIDFEITWWTGSAPREQRASRDEVVEAVKAALDTAGIEIPYPYRTLTFSRNEPDIIEAVAGRMGGRDGGREDAGE